MKGLRVEAHHTEALEHRRQRENPEVLGRTWFFIENRKWWGLFKSEALEARGNWHNIFQMLEEMIHESKILCSAKIQYQK